MGTDGYVGVQQSATPDRFVDNSVLVNDDGDTVYRQRVEDPELMALIRQLLESLQRFGTAFGVDGRLLVRLTDPAGTAQNVNAVQSGTWNIATVTTLTDQTNAGGRRQDAVVFAQMMGPVSALHSKIAVT